MRIVAGIYKNRLLQTPKGGTTRPTSGLLRETVFNICQHSIEGARFLELFAGSGAMGLEALSRGAASATFIDNSRESVQCIKRNLVRLRAEGQVLQGDVIRLLPKLADRGEQYDLVYVDPPYGADLQKGEERVSLSHEILNICDTTTLLAPSGLLFIEDTHDISPLNGSWQTLISKSTRRRGRAYLHQFEKKH